MTSKETSMTAQIPNRQTFLLRPQRSIAEYVGRTYKYGGDIMHAIEKLEVPVLEQPVEPIATATKTRTPHLGKRSR